MKRAIDDVEDFEAQPQVEETPTALAPYATQEYGLKMKLLFFGVIYKLSVRNILSSTLIESKQLSSQLKEGGGGGGGQAGFEKLVYNVTEIRRAIVEFVIIDEQSFRVVEGGGFKKLISLILPNYDLPSRFTVARQCLRIYQEEKQKLKRLIKGQRVCITSDTWTSLQNFTYMITRVRPLRVIMRNNFLHVRCDAHILNLIVKEGLSEQNEFISRVRNVVKYVKSSSARIASYKSYVEKVKLDTNGLLSLDVEPRWNSTYLMLNTAVKFEKAFSRMNIDDHKYIKYCLDSKGKIEHPSSKDWKDTIIVNYSKCDDFILTDMAKKMKVKFDKYWGDFSDMNMLLFVAVVLDPRYKMKYVEFLFKKYYNSVEECTKSDKVRDTLARLYAHYKSSISKTSCESIGDQTSKYLEKENDVDDKSDLDKYLKDNVEKIKDFNILSWWKASSEKYPIVSQIARDVLPIATSTVTLESVFSTGGRILDCYRSSLSSKTAEALICGQQWLSSTSKECKIEDLLDEIQKLETIEKEYSDSTLSID
ncbi:hypothetical protein P3L10_020189 [Capsicum annuum]